MAYNPDLHHRRSVRLKGYDYRQGGAYFVTICVHNRECLLGTVTDGTVDLNPFGEAVEAAWQWLAEQYSYISLDAWIVMHNHFHAIIQISDDPNVGASHETPLRKPLGQLMGAFKTVSTKHVNHLRNTPGLVLWQRNYYERVIRDETELNAIREYILNNPLGWITDSENPNHS